MTVTSVSSIVLGDTARHTQRCSCTDQPHKQSVTGNCCCCSSIITDPFDRHVHFENVGQFIKIYAPEIVRLPRHPC